MRRPGLVFLVPLIVAVLAGAVTLSLYPFVHFAQPRALYWLIALVVLAFVWAHRAQKRRRAQEALMHIRAFERLTSSWSARRDSARFALAALACFLLILAAAQPQWGEQTRRVQRKGTDIAIVLDASRSMLAEDVGPNRMKAATRELTELLDALDGDRVGLVVFAGVAFAQSPLTSDYGAIQLYLDRVNPDSFPAQGTALGVAIQEAHALLTGNGTPEFRRAPNQMILVISDGEDHETNPVHAAKLAQKDGIQVYTVGIGTTSGGRIPLHDARGRFEKYLTDRQGNVVHTRLEDTQLREIATAGGGIYMHYDGLRSTTPNLLAIIDQFDEAYFSSVLRAHYVNRGAFFLWPAFVLLFLALLLDDRPRTARRRRRWPRWMLLSLLFLNASCLDFRYEDPHVRRAIEKAEEGAYDAALEEIERANNDARTQHAFHFNRGRIHDESGQIDAAQEDFLHALGASNPILRVAALIGIGNTLVQQENYRDAITRYTRALLLDPNNAAARRNLEIAHRKLFPLCAALEDTFEPNDRPEDASDLPPASIVGPHASLYTEVSEGDETPPTLTLCSGNEDWFRLPLIGGESMEIDATLRRLRDDNGGPPLPGRIGSRALRMTVVDGRGKVVAVDNGRADDRDRDGNTPAKKLKRHLDLPMLSTENAPYYLFLSAADDLEYSYTLQVRITPPCSALEDGFEPNDRASQAYTLEEGTHTGRLCNDNRDWFQMDLEAGEHLFVDVQAQPPEEDTEPKLRHGFHVGQPPAPPNLRRQEHSERIEWASGERATPSTALWGFATQDDVELNYVMDVHRFAPCPDGNDRFEPNDRPNDAATITADQQEIRHLRLCPNDQDWFLMDLQPKENADENTLRPFSARIDLPDDVSPQHVHVELWDLKTGRRLATSHPVTESSDDENDEISDAPAPDSHAAIATTELPENTEAVILRVYGAETFYHLSFPDTPPPDSEEDGASEDPNDGSDDEPEDDPNAAQGQEDGADEPDTQDNEDASDGEDDAPELSPEDAITADEESIETPQEPPRPSEEEMKRQALLDLLNSLEHDEVNLQLQQALERQPPPPSQNEW